MVVIIVVLLLFDIDYASFNQGGQYISYLLTPATVCLAIPMYKQLHLLKSYRKAVVFGLLAGVISSLGSVLGLSVLFGLTHQQYVTLDELFLAEDICYKSGCLISPAMMAEFLFPYYQQLLANIKARQIDRARHLYVQVDTDGHAPAVIPLYQQAIGMDAMCPFEVAAGCDVVELGLEDRRVPVMVAAALLHDARMVLHGNVAEVGAEGVKGHAEAPIRSSSSR